MILDLRKDSREIHKFLAQRIKDYLASEAKTRGPISAVYFILPDGTRKNAINITEKTYSAMLGKLLKHVALSAKKKKLFSKLPRHPICHIDIEEFNGSRAWPALEKFSKASRI